MDRNQEEVIVEILTEGNEGFRRECEAHQRYERILEEFRRRTHLTSEEEIEKKKIQKLKLAGKDRMARMIAQYRRQHPDLRTGILAQGDGES